MWPGDEDTPAREAVSEGLATRFSVDPRALAALRAALGTLLLADLALRARYLTAFYTDQGVLPRQLLCETYGAACHLTLHGLSGGLWLQVALFAAAGLAAAALAVGCRTRWAAGVSLALLASLHLRNPLVLNGGDALLRRLLFWGVLLPLGARWSLDADGSDAAAGPTASVASAGLLLQVVAVYTVNGALKVGNPAWLGGAAIQRAFALDQFTVLLGPLLARQPAVLEAASKVWLLLLLSSFLLVALRGWRRAAVAGLFAGVHLGMLATMRLGLFPLVSLAALLPFLPPAFWDRVEARLPTRGATSGAGAGEPEKGVPGLGVGLPVGAALAGGRWRRRAGTAVAALALVTMGTWNAAAVAEVQAPTGVGGLDPAEDRWDMFVEPYRVDVWYTAPGVLENGAAVHAFHGEAIPTDEAPSSWEMFPSSRWRKYLVDVWKDGSEAHVRAFADRLCRRWDARHATDLAGVRVRRHIQHTDLDGSGSVDHATLLERTCP